MAARSRLVRGLRCLDEIGPLRDLFAARGFLVFEPNYRGSDNLGNAHEHAIYRDPGAGPGQ